MEATAVHESCQQLQTSVSALKQQRSCVKEVLLVRSGKAEADTSYSGAEQEASICRICLMELETGEALEMDCLCKGELALAHIDCVIKWFTVRGNDLCDICGEAVRNLPLVIFSSVWHKERPGEESDSDDGPIDSSWCKIAALIVTTAIGFVRQKIEDLAEFP